MRSIRGQLSLSLVVTFVSLFFIQLVLVNFTIEHLTEEFVLDRLQHDAESLLTAVSFEEEEPKVSKTRVADIYQHPYSGHYYQLRAGDHIEHSRSLWDFQLELQDVATGEWQIQYRQGPIGQKLMIYVAGFEKDKRQIMISIGQDVRDLQEDVVEMQVVYGLISLLAMLCLIYFQFMILGHGFRPWNKLQQQLRAMEKGELNKLDENVPLELRAQVKEINRLVELLGQRVERSRNALGNLAHAMKTPLTVTLRTLDDVENNAEKKAVIKQQLNQVQQLIERELKRARFSSGNTSDRFDVKKDIDSLVLIMQKVYEDKKLNIDIVREECGVCSFDRQDILEVIGNLLDNACKWAESSVLLTVETQNEFMVRVEDDGPGVDETTCTELMGRGVRVDESVAGHGLGLAIVQDAVKHYGGKMRVGRSDVLGGFSVDISLPC